MPDKCPGTSFLRTPALNIKQCPVCNEEIEIFSTDSKVVCGTCGFAVFNDAASCINWCSFAEECLGKELNDKLKKK